jgi:UDP-glucuronate 4-epimerase
LNILITGCAGFIGFHLSYYLLKRGEQIIGIDNLNDYYDPELKKSRLSLLNHFPHFQFLKFDITDRSAVEQLFQKHHFDTVIHLAAQAGVRYSISQPFAYIDTNLVGFSHILEGCRQQSVKHFIFASSSSVYGNNDQYPFSETDSTESPLALYGATKKANELMAYSYAHLFKLPCTGLRFFTVYGPWGRPDMALFKFTQNILANKPIDLYNAGQMWRNFTYIDDAIAAIVLILDHPSARDVGTSNPFYQVYNIASSQSVQITELIEALEEFAGKKAIKNELGMQLGDVPQTHADISKLRNRLGYEPKTTIKDGVQQFLHWYTEYTA